MEHKALSPRNNYTSAPFTWLDIVLIKSAAVENC